MKKKNIVGGSAKDMISYEIMAGTSSMPEDPGYKPLKLYTYDDDDKIQVIEQKK